MSYETVKVYIFQVVNYSILSFIEFCWELFILWNEKFTIGTNSKDDLINFITSLLSLVIVFHWVVFLKNVGSLESSNHSQIRKDYIVFIEKTDRCLYQSDPYVAKMSVNTSWSWWYHWEYTWQKRICLASFNIRETKWRNWSTNRVINYSLGIGKSRKVATIGRPLIKEKFISHNWNNGIGIRRLTRMG